MTDTKVRDSEDNIKSLSDVAKVVAKYIHLRRKFFRAHRDFLDVKPDCYTFIPFGEGDVPCLTVTGTESGYKLGTVTDGVEAEYDISFKDAGLSHAIHEALKTFSDEYVKGLYDYYSNLLTFQTPRRDRRPQRRPMQGQHSDRQPQYRIKPARGDVVDWTDD